VIIDLSHILEVLLHYGAKIQRIYENNRKKG